MFAAVSTRQNNAARRSFTIGANNNYEDTTPSNKHFLGQQSSGAPRISFSAFKNTFSEGPKKVIQSNKTAISGASSGQSKTGNMLRLRSNSMFLSPNMMNNAAKSANTNKIFRKTTLAKTPLKADKLTPAKQNLVS